MKKHEEMKRFQSGKFVSYGLPTRYVINGKEVTKEEFDAAIKRREEAKQQKD